MNVTKKSKVTLKKSKINLGARLPNGQKVYTLKGTYSKAFFKFFNQVFTPNATEGQPNA